MSKSKFGNRKALAKKRSEAMDRFWRDLDDYRDLAWTAALIKTAKEAEAAESDVQYILNLETKDDD